MKEFGSDFHSFIFPKCGRRLADCFLRANYYASGRQALEHLISFRNYHRLFVPSYFCQEALIRIRRMLPVIEYDHIPGEDFNVSLKQYELTEQDAVLRVNYFGLITDLQGYSLRAEIIEDHTHAPYSEWVLNSKAAWCISSLRKVFPIPDGGMLWSPSNKELPTQPETSPQVTDLALRRFHAMELKTDYLTENLEDKNTFRNIFIDTEHSFDSLETSGISHISKGILDCLDIDKWGKDRAINWQILRRKISDTHTYRIMEPQESYVVPFSFIILFNKPRDRDQFRTTLINNRIYPAVLWPIDNYKSKKASTFSKRMLSLHCDGRYTETEIEDLSDKIKFLLECFQ